MKLELVVVRNACERLMTEHEEVMFLDGDDDDDGVDDDDPTRRGLYYLDVVAEYERVDNAFDVVEVLASVEPLR